MGNQNSSNAYNVSAPCKRVDHHQEGEGENAYSSLTYHEEGGDRKVLVSVPPDFESLPPVEHTVSSSTEGGGEIDTISALSDPPLVENDFKRKVRNWSAGDKYYSELVKEGLEYLGKDASKVIMLYESPSSSSHETSFFNSQVFNYHDYPPFPPYYKSVLSPCRYSIVNGDAYPSYLRDGPPEGLLKHWKEVLPGEYREPTFVKEIDECSLVNAYLPVEHLSLERHVNAPHVHYHLAGKDAIYLMTKRTTRLLANTQDIRPCVAKVTHAMGSKGIFVIRNDQDEVDFNSFLEESGHPTFVVTDFVDIARNIACHFFIHPNGEVIWIGSNENKLLPDGSWSTDSTLSLPDEDHLKELQLPCVQDVVEYCRNLGFWGFCGIDVLIDREGVGYLVDVNPRCTGSSPALMILHLLHKEHGFEYGLFRRNSAFAFRGTAKELLLKVDQHNAACKTNRIVLSSFYEKSPNETTVHFGVYGMSLEECEKVVNEIAPPLP